MASILKRGGLTLLLILLIMVSSLFETLKVAEARRPFNRIFVKINGYAKCDLMNARKLFDEMPGRNGYAKLKVVCGAVEGGWTCQRRMTRSWWMTMVVVLVSVARVVNSDKDQVRVKRKTLEAVLDQCQKALELLSANGIIDDNDDYSSSNINESCDEDDGDDVGPSTGRRVSMSNDGEADLLCSLLKSRLECPDFLEKLESAQVSVPQNLADWDVVGEKDLWEGGNIASEEDYVLVRQDDIVDGIACFMAAYLISLKETKDLSPKQLQDALSKTFSMKKQKGKLRKAWDGSKVLYNVASWGATAIGIYQNPAILRAASTAFWTSCNVISKLF
uniref:Uncharacterized protein n=1 Tax=Tanacetum cinerariifolium TaxID=118510 RepID=A0A6L2K2X0_TANCI|nr:hypothetical protein [Tanacetum cinerariifolium]